MFLVCLCVRLYLCSALCKVRTLARVVLMCSTFSTGLGRNRHHRAGVVEHPFLQHRLMVWKRDSGQTWPEGVNTSTAPARIWSNSPKCGQIQARHVENVVQFSSKLVGRRRSMWDKFGRHCTKSCRAHRWPKSVEIAPNSFEILGTAEHCPNSPWFFESGLCQGGDLRTVQYCPNPRGLWAPIRSGVLGGVCT